MDKRLTDATEIIVNAKHTEDMPAILVVYPDEVITISLFHMPMVLESLKILEKENKIKVESSNNLYTLFVPVTDEEKRDTPVCDECGSICAKRDSHFVCLNCGHEQL